MSSIILFTINYIDKNIKIIKYDVTVLNPTKSMFHPYSFNGYQGYLKINETIINMILELRQPI
jgi:hypothetical protein